MGLRVADFQMQCEGWGGGGDRASRATHPTLARIHRITNSRSHFMALLPEEGLRRY